MPLTDKPITVIAAQTAISALTLYPQPDGSVVLVAVGATKDSGGSVVALKEARLQVTGLAVIDNLVARGLTELRKANGLEV
jgi:hypothetical protein